MQINSASLLAAQQARTTAAPQKPAQSFQPMDFAQTAEPKASSPAQPAQANTPLARLGSQIDIRV